LSTTNTLKLTVKGTGEVFVNQAEVTAFDITSENGTVHVLDAVVLPYETSVDVAIDNGFTSLAAAVIKAELLPALTNPLTELTVFAPTNDAFDDLAVALGTDLNGVLASPELTNILLYHVVSGTVTSGDLTNGAVPTLNGQTINVDLTSGVLINSSNVTTPDIIVDNGVVHVIDAVLVPAVAGLDQGSIEEFRVYPNPANDNITIDMLGNTFQEVMVHDLNGRLVLQSAISNNKSFDITSIKNGTYILTLVGNDQISTQKLQIL
ncbi:MAG: fasciclin domain-containing protein, partial [Crocinitomicaceae bacterium]|nr:fasciclin domain-containing protein [Crocinitomicaceae bacterium]